MRIQELILTETAEEIAAVNQTAEAITLYLKKHLRPRGDNRDPVVYKLSQMDLPKTRNSALAELISQASIECNSRPLGASWHPRERLIRLGDNTTEMLVSEYGSVMGDPASTIAHELQHGLDDFKQILDRRDYPERKDSERARQRRQRSLAKYGSVWLRRDASRPEINGYSYNMDYWNEDREINARFTQACRDIQRRIERMFYKYQDLEGVAAARNSIRQELEKWISEAFEKHRISQVFKGGVSNPGYRRMLTRLYKYYNYHWDRLNQIKPGQVAQAALQAEKLTGSE